MAKHKGTMVASQIIFGLVIFFLVFAGFNQFYSTTAAQYNYTNPDLEKYNELAEIEEDVDALGGVVGNSTVGESSNFFFISAGSIWNAFKFFFSFPNYLLTIVSNAVADLGIPSFVVQGVAILSLLVVTMTAVSAAMRKEV